MQGRDSVKDVIAFPKNSKGEDSMVESPGHINQRQLKDYHLKFVSGDSQHDEGVAEVASSMPPNNPDEKKLEAHMNHLVDEMGGKTSQSQLRDENDPPATAAVMVGGTSDIIKSDLISLFKRDRSLSITEMHGAIGESVLIGLGLERATPEEIKKKATVWGLPVEMLEELVRLHQGTVAENLESGRSTTNAEEKADRFSDPANTPNAVQTR